jgi:hypothetical protein
MTIQCGFANGGIDTDTAIRCEDIVNEQVLTKEWRDKMSKKYYRAARGDLLGWSWMRKYGCEVIHHIQLGGFGPEEWLFVEELMVMLVGPGLLKATE